MARFGTWSPLSANWASQSKMSTVDIISIHTMVGSLTGTDGMFRKNGFGGTFSHFGVGGHGECTQWQDTAYRAAANYNGNWHIISVECADVGAPFPTWNLNDGSAVPAFTAEQCETLAQLIATMCKAHDIPCVLIPDAKPGRRGIGYHRMGVPGYMVAGAEQWSTAQGKVCPGNRRIAQIPAIVTRAQQILAGATTPEEDLPLNAADIELIKHAVAETPIGNVPGTFPRIKGTNDVMLWQLIGPLVDAAEATKAQVTQRLDDRVGTGKRDTQDTVLGFAIEAHAAAIAALDAVNAVSAKLDALTAVGASSPTVAAAGSPVVTITPDAEARIIKGVLDGMSGRLTS